MSSASALIDDNHQTQDNVVRLPYKFIPRHYQRPMFEALVPELFPPTPTALDKILDRKPMLKEAVKQAVIVFHRRAGKDKCAINILTCKAMLKVGNYLYMAPEAAQARKIIWQGLGSDGMKFIDHVPAELIVRKKEQEMFIELINGSTIQICGSDNYDSLVGTNPQGVVFSEYAIQNPAALQYFRPMLVENQGWSLFIYTFRGRNHGYTLYKTAKQRMDENNPAWFCQLETIETTHRPDGSPVVTIEQFKQEIEDGMPEATALQEYYCDPNQGNVGAYFADIMAKLYKDDSVGKYPYNPSHQVITSWDLGINDNNSIWFFQIYNEIVHVIDCMSEANVAMVEWIRRVKNKPYNYFAHIAPHDIRVRDPHTGFTRLAQCAKLGLHFDVAPKIPLADGITAVRTILPICVFNEATTITGAESLVSYQRKYDEVLQNFANKPLHDQHSHYADAFRMFAIVYEDYMDIDKPQKKFTVKRSV